MAERHMEVERDRLQLSGQRVRHADIARCPVIVSFLVSLPILSHRQPPRPPPETSTACQHRADMPKRARNIYPANAYGFTGFVTGGWLLTLGNVAFRSGSFGILRSAFSMSLSGAPIV